MPEQKALPAPVRMSTIAFDVSTSLQRAQQIVNQLEADGVALVGTVQRDGGDARVVCELDVLYIHR
jgi:hypothetical protein